MKNVYEHCISNCIIENKLLSWVKHIKMTAVLVSRICLHPQNLTKISFIFIYMLFFRIWQQTNINRDTCVKYQVLQWPRYRDIDHCLRRFDRSLSTQNRSNCRVGFRRVRSGQSVPAAALAINGFSSGSSIVLSTFFKFSKQPEAMAPSGLVYAKGLSHTVAALLDPTVYIVDLWRHHYVMIYHKGQGRVVKAVEFPRLGWAGMGSNIVWVVRVIWYRQAGLCDNIESDVVSYLECNPLVVVPLQIAPEIEMYLWHVCNEVNRTLTQFSISLLLDHKTKTKESRTKCHTFLLNTSNHEAEMTDLYLDWLNPLVPA